MPLPTPHHPVCWKPAHGCCPFCGDSPQDQELCSQSYGPYSSSLLTGIGFMQTYDRSRINTMSPSEHYRFEIISERRTSLLLSAIRIAYLYVLEIFSVGAPYFGAFFIRIILRTVRICRPYSALSHFSKVSISFSLNDNADLPDSPSICASAFHIWVLMMP